MASHSHPSYTKIYFILLILFAVSVAGPELAEIFQLEGATRLTLILVTAFGIALVKAYYVLAYFMHLKFEKIYAPYILFSMVAILVVFYFGVATDSGKAEGHNWRKVYVEPVVAAGEHPEGDHGAAAGSHSGTEEDGHADGSH